MDGCGTVLWRIDIPVYNIVVVSMLYDTFSFLFTITERERERERVAYILDIVHALLLFPYILS